MINYIYNYIFNPFFYYFDYLYEFFYCEVTEEEEVDEEIFNYKYYYDIENDQIILPYKNKYNEKYILKVDRCINKNLKDEINFLKHIKNEEEPYVSIQINGIQNNNVRKYFGPNGIHLNYKKLSVKDILNTNELSTFERLELMDNFCDYKYIIDINENIL